jgi:hypothetical protein
MEELWDPEIVLLLDSDKVVLDCVDAIEVVEE